MTAHTEKRYWRGNKERHDKHPEIRAAHKAGFDDAITGRQLDDTRGGDHPDAYRTGYREGAELAQDRA